MTSRPRSSCRRSPPARRPRVPLSVQFPGPGRTTSRSSFPTTSCRATTSTGRPCRSRTRCLIRLVDGEPSPSRSAPRSTTWPRRCRSASARPRPGGSRSSSTRISSSPAARYARRARAGQCRAPIAPSRPIGWASWSSDGMGLLIFTGAKLDVGLYNDLLFRKNDRLLPCPLKTLDRREHPRAVRRAAASLAAREAAGAEAVGARARAGPADHEVDEPSEPGPGPRAGPLEQPGPVARGDRAGRAAKAGSCSGRPPPTAPATTGRSSRASSWPCARPSAARPGRPRSPTRSRPASGCGASSTRASRSPTPG